VCRAVRWRTDVCGAGAEHGRMKPVTTFSEYYMEWLEAIRAMIPGGSQAAKPAEKTPKEVQAAATQEWEDEGGSCKPEKSTDPAPGSKIPL
jgi:hypothetical protein